MAIIFSDATDWIANSKTLTVSAALSLLFVLFIWKGIPWIKQQLEKKEEFLLNEIAEARKERDEARHLRSEELKQFMDQLRLQAETNRRGFAEMVRALKDNRGK